MNSKNVFSKKVYVGLSGGVDSSVSATLLKEQGYDVTGVFIKVWYPEFLNCDWKSEMRDAMRVCAKINIPFIKLDLEKEYKREVIDYMIEEYRRGRTPNPDVMCNKHVKFGAFFDWAIKDGADFVATGHYAQSRNGRLFESSDKKKDQTYFLWTLTKGHLLKTIFPIGHLEKNEVRKLAKKYDLPTSSKKDSQGLCFIGQVDMDDFLKRYIDTEQGNVLNEEGQTVGRHDGAILYTLGQRHGFKIDKQDNNERAHYVVSKDLIKNTITISHDRLQKKEDGKNNRHTIESLNIISDADSNTEDEKESEVSKELEALTRYNAKKVSVVLNKKESNIEFQDDILVTPGQSVVFYKDEECLGGAVIS